MESNTVTLYVNENRYVFSMGDAYGQVPPSEILLDTLRNRLGLTGAKKSCDEGACGCCTVIKDGDAVPSCMQLTADCDGCHITTIEGLADPKTGELSKLQQAFLDHYAFVYLVRYGAVEFQGGIHRCIGRTDVPLGERGRTQAEHLAEYFATHAVTRIFTSPLKRCRETAQILSHGRYPVEVEEGLREALQIRTN